MSSAQAVAKPAPRPTTGRDRHVPFIDHLHITREQAEGGVATVSVELRPELLNNHAGGHGGVVMTLLDCAMAHAALSKLDYTKEVVTVDMSVAFLKPATGRLVAVGTATGGGKSICFCEARITNPDGQLAARAMGTFKYHAIDRTPPHPEKP
jgi:uncharacterized protein (TIGR00369 family)